MEPTLCRQSTPGDAVSYVFESRIHIEHLGWRCLFTVRHGYRERGALTYLRVFAALKEGCYSDQSDIVVPHHCVLLLIIGDLEGILED